MHRSRTFRWGAALSLLTLSLGARGVVTDARISNLETGLNGSTFVWTIEDTYEGQTFFEYVLRCFWGGKAADHGVQHLGLFHRSGPNTVRPSIPISLSTYGSLTFAVVAL